MNGLMIKYIIPATLMLGISQLAPGNPPSGATMHGVVTDPSGAVIPNAKVFVAGANYKQMLLTDERGAYIIAGLPAGEYRVRIKSNGFAPYFKSGLVAEPGYETEADAQLNIGRIMQEITVTE